jgi:hypothetical protein
MKKARCHFGDEKKPKTSLVSTVQGPMSMTCRLTRWWEVRGARAEGPGAAGAGEHQVEATNTDNAKSDGLWVFILKKATFKFLLEGTIDLQLEFL